MNTERRRGRWLLLLFAIILIAGCARPLRAPGQNDSKTGVWTGRLAVQVEGDSRQSFSASFELQGQPSAGQLKLFTPLGGTAAVLTWLPGSATLQSDGQTRQFESVDALLAEVAGTAIPVSALFDWLAGTQTLAPGWQADLSQLEQGRLRAQRLAPPPATDLRIVLDR